LTGAEKLGTVCIVFRVLDGFEDELRREQTPRGLWSGGVFICRLVLDLVRTVSDYGPEEKGRVVCRKVA
jgi:hypothetical protein